MTTLDNAITKTMNTVFKKINEHQTVENNVDRIALFEKYLGKIANIKLDEIDTSENIRQQININSPEFIRLVESIKKYGVLENVIAQLKVSEDRSSFTLICIAGHRRILAAKTIGTIDRIPCLILPAKSNDERIGTALSENLNREDLYCLDIGEALSALSDLGWSEDDIAKHFCKNKRTIRHYIKIANYSPKVKRLLRENEDKLSTRKIFRNFAYKKFADENELYNAINNFLSPKRSKKAKSKNKIDYKERLDAYLKNETTLSSIIKEEIIKAFNAIGIL